jgi:hypothetical protein
MKQRYSVAVTMIRHKTIETLNVNTSLVYINACSIEEALEKGEGRALKEYPNHQVFSSLGLAQDGSGSGKFYGETPDETP